MGICALAPAEKKLLAKKVGAELVRNHGKRQKYSIQQVKNAARNQQIPYDWDCWAFSFFSSREDFDRFHRETGEKCDYDFMNGKMIEAVSESLPPATPMAVMADSTADSDWLADFFDFFDFSDD